MKRFLLKVTLLLLVFSLALCGYRASKPKVSGIFLELAQPFQTWGFLTKQGYSIWPMRLDLSPGQLIPHSQPCCTGSYFSYLRADFLNTLKASLENKNIGLYFPAVGGFSKLKINNKTIDITPNDSFSSIGPL